MNNIMQKCLFSLAKIVKILHYVARAYEVIKSYFKNLMASVKRQAAIKYFIFVRFYQNFIKHFS